MSDKADASFDCCTVTTEGQKSPKNGLIINKELTTLSSCLPKQILTNKQHK